MGTSHNINGDPGIFESPDNLGQGISNMLPTVSSQQLALLNEYQVAEFLNISVATVRRWRLLRQGPGYRKLGASVRYHAADLSAWVESRPSGGGRS